MNNPPLTMRRDLVMYSEFAHVKSARGKNLR
jgi:hypothetical protein